MYRCLHYYGILKLFYLFINMHISIVKWTDFGHFLFGRSTMWNFPTRNTLFYVSARRPKCVRWYTGLPSLWWWVGKYVVLIVGVCLISLKQRCVFFIIGDTYDIPDFFVFLCAYVITTESVPDAFTVCNHRFHIQDVYIVKTPANLGIRHNILGVETLY